MPRNAEGIKFLESTDQRLRQPDAYFATEYQRINARRAHFGFSAAQGTTRPPALVGLALSGGGIRSNAFQLGILAGLREESFGTATLLDRVDYLSSVSGGTWASLGVWAWPGDLSQLFGCLDAAADEKAMTAQCQAGHQSSCDKNAARLDSLRAPSTS